MTAPLTLRTFTQDRLSVTAPRQELHEITGDIVAWLDGRSVAAGQLMLYLRHTSTSLLIQENEDPDVARDRQARPPRISVLGQ